MPPNNSDCIVKGKGNKEGGCMDCNLTTESYFRCAVRIAAMAASLYVAPFIGLQSAHANSIDACIGRYADAFGEFTSEPTPTENRHTCLQVLEASDRADARYVAARIRLAMGDDEAAEALLKDAARQGSEAAQIALTALRMTKFEELYPHGWRSSETPLGADLNYTLEYASIVEASRPWLKSAEHRPLIDDFIFGHDPSPEARLQALKSLLKHSGGESAGKYRAQRLLGRRVHEGSIAPEILAEPSIARALNALLDERSNHELIWWSGCAGRHSYIYGASGIRILGREITSIDPREVIESALLAAKRSRVGDQSEWRFRQALLKLEDANLTNDAVRAEIEELELLSSRGHSGAMKYLEDAAVGEAAGAYSRDGFGLATDLCGQETRIVFDNGQALDWWTKAIEAGNCDAIADLIDTERYLAKKSVRRNLPSTTVRPLRMLLGCKSPMNSRYLDLV